MSIKKLAHMLFRVGKATKNPGLLRLRAEPRSLAALGMTTVVCITATLVCFLVLSMSAWSVAQNANQPTDQSQIGYKSAADADQKKTLLLKDFQPVSMLHARLDNIDRAK
jgi:hypothetical protein